MKYVGYTVLGLLALVGLAVLAGAVWMFFILRDAANVPHDKWVCANRFGDHEVLWNANYPGTNVQVESEEQVQLFAFSCLENKKSNCFDNAGWVAGQIDVFGGPLPYAQYFDHESSDIDDKYRHHVRLSGTFATSLIAAFRTGKTAEIRTIGKNAAVLKLTKIDLAGFGPAMDACIARWKQRRTK